MPAIVANAKHFLISTDYPQDKVVWLYSGSATFDGMTSLTIPHGLPFIPLIDFTWSYQSNFTTTYTDNAGPSPATAPGFLFDLQVSAMADATNVYLSARGPAAAATGYYRLYAFQPSTSNVVLSPTVSSADAFVLNSSHNYSKLLTAGYVDHGSGAFSLSVAHNLGYVPQVQIWHGDTQVGQLSWNGDDASGGWQIEVTATHLLFTASALNNFFTGRFHYRIYMDE